MYNTDYYNHIRPQLLHIFFFAVIHNLNLNTDSLPYFHSNPIFTVYYNILVEFCICDSR